jgi:hypothetical protein
MVGNNNEKIGCRGNDPLRFKYKKTKEITNPCYAEVMQPNFSVKKPIWYSELKNIVIEMINQFGGPNFLSNVENNEITWKDIQKEYSKRKIRNRIINVCNLRTLDATKTMSPWFELVFLDIFGENPNISYKDIILDLWASAKRVDEKRREEILPKIKKLLFYELDLFRAFFPDIKCSSISSYSRRFEMGPNAMTKYIQTILKDWISIRLDLLEFSDLFQQKYQEIWNFNWQEFQKKKISYPSILRFIQSKGGNLITSLQKWNDMQDYPANRKIEIKCSKNHEFPLIVTSLLNRGAWCHECREYKCEKIACMFMDEIFNFDFIRQANLGIIYKLPTGYSKKIVYNATNSSPYVHDVCITRQTFDCYGLVEIHGINIRGESVSRFIRIAFEYDGIQHDKYNESYHRGNIANYYKQRCRDIAKDGTAFEYDTIVIRVKEIDGYDLSTLNSFHREIVKQFQKLTEIKLPPMNRLYYDIRSNKIKTTNDVIDIPLDLISEERHKSTQRSVLDY